MEMSVSVVSVSNSEKKTRIAGTTITFMFVASSLDRCCDYTFALFTVLEHGGLEHPKPVAKKLLQHTLTVTLKTYIWHNVVLIETFFSHITPTDVFYAS